VRRESNDPAECLLAMHKVLLEIGDRAAGGSTATIGHWNAPAATFRWVTAGDEPPLRITADGQLKPLDGDRHPHLGSHDFPAQPHTNETRLDNAERLLLLSDSFTHPSKGLGLPAIRRAVAKADDTAAPATLRAIEDQLREANPDQLDDDATIIVLAPSGMIGPSD
jgi:serine phosphatase RsbU (regulator of sigma subunit)